MSEHEHNWWCLCVTTAGPVWKCDCGAINEPLNFWQRLWRKLKPNHPETKKG